MDCNEAGQKNSLELPKNLIDRFNGLETKRKFHTYNDCNSLKEHKKQKTLKDDPEKYQNCGSYLSLPASQQRRSLPVYSCKQRILLEINRSDTLLFMGETGSGKTTQIPQFLLSAGFGNSGVIAVTQPRRVAVITIAKRVANELGSKLGDIVGYAIRFENCFTAQTRIQFVTDGWLLQQVLVDRLLMSYSVIMLDEAHERTINNDLLFGLVKESQRQRKKKNLLPLKIIVTSATMDIDHLGKYFGVRGMYLEGKTYPVQIMHAKESQNDYLNASLVTLFEIHRSAPANHDVLVFLTGQDEIEAMAQQVRIIAKNYSIGAPSIRVFPLYSKLPQNKQLECFLPSPNSSRKIILATNIAETSITIPGIRYVIDSGFVKRRIFNPENGLNILKIVRISQAQAWQRSGRAGRESEGKCYRTYTKREMESFEVLSKPEILRSDICTNVLQLLALGINCQTFDFLDRPSPSAVDSAYQILHSLDAIKNISKPELTTLGRQMVKFPLDYKLSKILLTAQNFGCMAEMLSLVAMLSVENVFVHCQEKKELADLAHLKFKSKYGDHLTLLNVYNDLKKSEKVKSWCHENFLNARNLLYASEVRKQLVDIALRLELPINSCGNDFDKVRKCLLVGYHNNIAELQSDNTYLTVSSRQRAKIHPSSTLYGSQPTHIIFNEIISSESIYVRIVTEINFEWVSNESLF